MVIAMPSCAACFVGRPLSTASGKRRMAKRNLWLLARASASILLLFPPAWAMRHRGGGGLNPGPQGGAPASTEVREAVCKGGESGEAFTATLSETKRKVTLQCAKVQLTVVPDLKKGWVCPAVTSNLAECETPTDQPETKATNKAISLSVLMGGTQESPVNWVESPAVGAAGGTSYELNLPDAPLPLLDSNFVAGCKAAAGGADKDCKLTVTVEARKSAAAGQTAYCAYGAKSNVAKPTVTMTQQNNTMTLVCGSEAAAVQPAEYKTAYCADDSVGADCKKETFTSIIAGFESTWWTDNEGPKNVTLTIPPEHFPDSPKTIHLGCVYTPPTTGGEAESAGTTSKVLCKVDVVISAKESSASGRTVATLPGLTAGAAVLSLSVLTWL